MESYKSNSRKLIQDWLNIVGNKKNQEWMIIYCAEKTKGNRLFNMGATASVYEKLKTDFNLKKERYAFPYFSRADQSNEIILIN